MNEKENRIREERTIEATRKGLMGSSGKIGAIVRTMGSPIIAQTDGGGWYGSSYHDLEPYSAEKENPFELVGGSPEKIQSQLPYFDMAGEEPVGTGWREERNYERQAQSTNTIGWVFDGLSRGLHLEIKYMKDSSEIVVFYKGYLVYKEVAGELEAYVPGEDTWEPKIDQLSLGAMTKEKEKKKEELEQLGITANRKKTNWLDKMKRQWGL